MVKALQFISNETQSFDNNYLLVGDNDFLYLYIQISYIDAILNQVFCKKNQDLTCMSAVHSSETFFVSFSSYLETSPAFLSETHFDWICTIPLPCCQPPGSPLTAGGRQSACAAAAVGKKKSGRRRFGGRRVLGGQLNHLSPCRKSDLLLALHAHPVHRRARARALQQAD